MAHVTNLNFRTVEARRYQKQKQAAQQVRIDNNLTVTSLEATGDDTAQVEFSYTASYGPLGVIKIDGGFQYQDAAAGDLVATWQEKRQMPPDTASQLHTTIMQACLPEAVMLAKSIQLPPPIPMPQIRFQKQGGKATASTDADPAVS
jgi:hypothetical protein